MPITADMIDGLFEPDPNRIEKSAGADDDGDETDSDGKRKRKRKPHTPHDAAAPTPKEAREGYEMPEVA